VPHRKTTLLYDSLRRITYRTESRYEGNEWGDPVCIILTYDDQGDTLSVIQKEWTGDDTMEITAASSFDYDNKGHRITGRHTDDHGHENEFISTYDTNGLLIHFAWTAKSYGKITETGDNTYEYSSTHKSFKQSFIHANRYDGHSERTISLDTFIYDGNDSLISETAITDFLDTMYHGSFQHRFRYDTLYHSLVQEHICWDNMTCDWYIYSIDSTNYDTRHLVTRGYTWYLGAPHDDEMRVYEYNEAGQCLSILVYKGKNNEWHHDFNVIYTYDEHGLMVRENLYGYIEGKKRVAEHVTCYHYEAVPK